ncbi:MAG: TrkH family potassium uptake protein [Candidatus Omnitrophica bacterium]|nr:TrkH family potassium uptake protein [Candidatus Omnitrophota bacterium]
MKSPNNIINRLLDSVIGVVGAASLVLLLIEWGMMPIIKGMGITMLDRIDNIVLVIFLLSVISRFIKSESKKEYFKNYWIDLLVFVPCFCFFKGIHNAKLFLVIREAIVLFGFWHKNKFSQKLISLLGLKPAHLLIASFMMTILIGTFLLTLPISTQTGQGLNFVDALFTATSATCVTGLIVRDTGTFFSGFGQFVILALIQIGALGIMTFSVTLFLFAGKQMSNKEAMTMQDVLDQDSLSGIRELIHFIAKMTIFVELLGAIFLYVGFEPYIADPWQRLYTSLFHSVSAFCNAGFSLFSDNLMQYVKDDIINLTIAFLIIFGGLGFIVVKDVWGKFVKKDRPKSLGLKVHTKIVLSITFFLILAGTICIFFAENNSAILSGMTLKDKILISFFQSVSTRTAGFNTIDIGKMANASIFSMIILMFIGASAGSTGGGIKTTTFWMLLKSFTSSMHSKDDIDSFKREIPRSIVQKSMAIFVLALSFVIIFMYLVSLFENLAFRDLIFEVVSAFGTVGLSTGITASLHLPGKILITLLMFLGRLGPLTVVLAFSGYKQKINYTFAQEKIMVG